MLRRLRLAPIMLLALGVVAGCSSSGGSPSASSSASASAPASASPSATSTAVSDSGANSLPAFPSATASPALPAPSTATAEQKFIAAVFTDAQEEWQSIFTKAGQQYHKARLVIFSSAVQTGCGNETSEVGPFYCPADQTVYLDLKFFQDMEQKYGVKGDFSQAFVVAHELGHHIQLLTGVTSQVQQLSQQHPAQANSLSVRTELQADCYAGVWAHSAYTRDLLEPGDLDEALTAAAAVGDDFLQKQATGSVQPEKWTHGSSAQRQKWLQTGYDKGQPSACDTFSVANP
ncbi:MAG: neutral zinc metallopeptidase [Actinobacteria bacterium]|nr:neutral zinc metallopeptidase [Actinomycetota bacterium]